MKYFIARNGGQEGPFDESELIAQGVNRETLVWCADMPNWAKVRDVPALAYLIPSLPEAGYGALQQPYAAPQQPAYQQPPYQQPAYQQPAYQQPQPQYGGQQYPAQQQQVPQYGGQAYNNNQMPPMPDNYLIWSILALVFCCWPLGIVAVIKSSNVSSCYQRGDYDGARRASESAKSWAIWTAVAGGIIILLYLILVMAGVAAGVSSGY